MLLASDRATIEIRKIITRSLLGAKPRYLIWQEVLKIIDRTLKRTPKSLQEVTSESLKKFAHQILLGLEDTLVVYRALVMAVLSYNNGEKLTNKERQTIIDNTPFDYDYEPKGKTLGTPNREFAKDYFSKITARVEQLSKQEPRDLDTSSSLHARAERQIRYEEKQDELESLRKKTNLILVSTHSDCSERCFRWQGRVYSLDHTSGTTSDGRKFIPLEVATNIPYVTRRGRVWMNGLFGFNCRHYAVEYKPNREFPTETEAERKKEYDITEKMRELERGVRKWANASAMWGGISNRRYVSALKKYSSEYSKYEAFCRANDRPIQMERLKFR